MWRKFRDELNISCLIEGNVQILLKDKVAIITGGAAGIGKATAERFVEEGAKVVICDVNEDIGHATIQALGAEHSFYKIDVADRQAVQEWVDAVVEKYDRVDILVNNAGITRDAALVKVKSGELIKQMTEADFDLVIDVNLKGVFNCTQAVAPYMIPGFTPPPAIQTVKPYWL